MKKTLLLLFAILSLSASAQTLPSYPTIKLTKTVEGTKQDSLLVINGADKIVKHLPISKLGTVKSVTGTEGITVANGTTTPVIGISSISQLKIAGLVTDLGLKVDKVTGKSLLSDTEISRLLGLSNYTHPANHPPSIITQDASNRFVTDTEKATWNAKQAALVSGTSLKTIEGQNLLGSGNIDLTKTDVGLPNADNTSDANKPISTAQQAAFILKENSSNKNIANGYAGLGTDGKLISSQLPDITISDTFITASQAAMLALIVQTGDVSVRTDINKSFILKGTDPALSASWQELLTPTSAVTTVFGRNGGITAQTNDYTADQILETATRVFQTPTQRTNNDATSPIQAQVNGKQATLASSTTNTLSGNTLQRAALIGDITSPLNSNTTTLSTVNASVGTFGNASTSTTKTVNAKGLITAISNAPIQIAESQVTSLVTDLAGKETAFAKNTAFNKNFGTTAGTVADGTHVVNTSNPHSVTKAQVGLSNVPNTDFTSAVAANTIKRSYPSADESKLAGIASGATANSTDAQLRDRTTHTGAQSISTVTGLQTTLDGKLNLTGGTLTGGLNGTTATFASSLTAADGNFSGKLKVITGGTGASFDIARQSDFSTEFTNSGSSNIITGKSSSGAGLLIVSASSDTNPNGDFRLSSRNALTGNSNANLTKDAFVFQNYLTPLLSIKRNGATTFSSSVTANKLTINNPKDGTWTTGETLGTFDFYGNDTSGNGAGVKNYIRSVSKDTFGAAFDLSFGTSNGSSAAVERLRIANTGESTFSLSVTATAFYQNSDRRLKNIYKRDGDVAYFKWKDGRDDKMHIGYIAQEVRKEFPDQVQKGNDKMLSVNYIEVLVAKIQDLEKRIQQLEKTK